MKKTETNGLTSPSNVMMLRPLIHSKRRILPLDERREMILDAALDVFSQDGYKEADVDEIARSACIGKGTIYRHFPSKHDLFNAVVDRGFDNLRRRMDAMDPCGLPFAEMVRIGLTLHVDFFVENPKYWRTLMLERHDYGRNPNDKRARGHQRFAAHLIEGIEAGISAGFLKKVDPTLATFSLMAMASVIVENYLHGKRDTRKRDIDNVVDIFLRGISK